MQERIGVGRLLLTIPEAAAVLGIGRTLVYDLVLRGELPSIKLGRARRIPIASLEKFIARRTIESSSRASDRA